MTGRTPTPTDPYRRIGLAANPFVADQSPGVDPALWIDRGVPTPTPSANTFVQVIGERGMGKTSLLVHWQGQIGGDYVHIEPGRGRWRQVPVGPVAYWDEADRLPAVILRRATTAAAGVRATIVVGTHRSLEKWGRRVRMEVRTIELAPPKPETVLRWASRRVDAVRLTDIDDFAGGGHVYEVDLDLATEVSAPPGSSWRDIGDRLHAHAAHAARQA